MTKELRCEEVLLSDGSKNVGAEGIQIKRDLKIIFHPQFFYFSK
jgi:hypothetical protein